jgi:hypothetical protein
MTSAMSRRIARLEKSLEASGTPEDRIGRLVASLFAWLIAYHLGDFKAGVEQPAAAYARALGYGEPRYLLEGMIREPDDHIRRDAEARVRLLATVGIDLHSAKPKAVIGALERLAAALRKGG